MMRLLFLVVCILCFKRVFLKIYPLSESDSQLRKSIASCILKVSEEYEFQDVITVSLTNADYKYYAISAVVTDQLLLSSLHQKLKWALLVKKSTRTGYSTNFFKKSDDYIVQIRNATDFTLTLTSLERRSSWNPHAKFLVLTTTFFNNSKLIVEYIFRTFWKANVLNAIVMLPTSKQSPALDMYTWFPFRNGRCGQHFDEAYIINTCSHGKMKRSQKLFPDKIPKNMNYCPVKVRTVIWPPYVIAPDNDDVNYRHNVTLTKGIEIMLMNTIAEVANLSIIYSISKTPQDWGQIFSNESASGMMGAVLSGESSIGIGAVAALNLRYLIFDNSVSYIWESVTWCIPHAMPIPKWKCLINIFQPDIWISIFSAYVLVTLSTWGLSVQERTESMSYRTSANCFQNILSMLLGITVKILPCVTKIRLLVMVWVVISLHLNAAFTSSLIRELTEPSFENPLENLQEMRNREFTFGLVSPTTLFFRNWKSLNNTYSNKVTTEECTDINECLDRTAYQRNMAVAIPRMYMRYVSKKYITRKGQPLLSWMKDDVISYPIEMIMTKGFPLLKRIDKLILRIKQAGLISKWKIDFLEMTGNKTTTSNDENKDVTLTLQHLEGAFILLNIGLTVSSIIFVIEFTSTIYIKRNIRKQNKEEYKSAQLVPKLEN